MKPIDFLIIGIILVIVGGAVAYIIKAKKNGKKCIGCPDAPTCQSHGACSGSCTSCSSKFCSDTSEKDN